MNIAIYRAASSLPVSIQEDSLKGFALEHGLAIDDFYVDFTPSASELESRVELKEFIYSIEENSRILIYDFWVLSAKVGELVKLFTCFFKKNITLINCSKNIMIEKNTPSLLSLGVINEFRDEILKDVSSIKSGRPRGSISKSKFDKLRNEILGALKNGESVSKIARELGVNRSSLKDYINTRNLKDIALSKKGGSDIDVAKISNDAVLESIKCPLKNRS